MPIYSYSFSEQNDTLPIRIISAMFNQDARVSSVLTLSLSRKYPASWNIYAPIQQDNVTFPRQLHGISIEAVGTTYKIETDKTFILL